LGICNIQTHNVDSSSLPFELTVKRVTFGKAGMADESSIN